MHSLVVGGSIILSALLTPAMAHGQSIELTLRDSTLVSDYRQVLEAKFLRRDPQPLAMLADSAYMVVTPGGVLESRSVALRGIQNFRLDSLSLTMPRVQRVGDTIVLTAELRLYGTLEGRRPDGSVRRADLTGPYRVLATFVGGSGPRARLLAESVTPVRSPDAATAGQGRR